MATDLTITRDTMIEMALRKLRIIGEGDTVSGGEVTADQVTAGENHINMLIKVLDGQPELTDKRDTDAKDAAVSAGDSSVALNAAVVHVQGAQYTRTDTGAVHTLSPMTRQEYIDTQNDKTTPTTGDPEHYYVTNQNGTKKMYIYPAVPANGNVNYWSSDEHDVVSTNAALDIPDRFHMWFLLKLVHIWSIDFGKRLEEIDRFEKLADSFWPVALATEGEEQEKDVKPEERRIRRRG